MNLKMKSWLRMSVESGACSTLLKFVAWKPHSPCFVPYLFFCFVFVCFSFVFVVHSHSGLQQSPPPRFSPRLIHTSRKSSQMSGYIFLASNIERIIIIWRASNQRQPSRCVHCTCSNQIYSQRKEQMTLLYSERAHNSQNPCVGVYDVIYFPLLNHRIFLWRHGFIWTLFVKWW